MELAGVAADTQQVEPTQLHARREPTRRHSRRRRRRGRCRRRCANGGRILGEGGGAQYPATRMRREDAQGVGLAGGADGDTVLGEHRRTHGARLQHVRVHVAKRAVRSKDASRAASPATPAAPPASDASAAPGARL
eukprot:scaffold60738_cov59-Phaeocystis_antarctica.AAC.1